MQITANTTGMLAGLAVAADTDARDHCVVVIKGTFRTGADGALTLAEQQQPLAVTDEHHGDPATTCVRQECDFALTKRRTDVIVVGKAVAPMGRRVKHLTVRLDVQGRHKDLTVHGDRRWVAALGGVAPGDPDEFSELPITFDRAWGGQDDSPGADSVLVETRNLVGVGFHPYRRFAEIVGRPVPNVEAVGRPISSPRERHEPVGLGCIGRAWQPRVALAGTYDRRWRDERAPYLPADFSTEYFQCAPQDQQFPHFRGGEVIRCVHMAPHGEVTYVLPTLHIPVTFRFRDGAVERTAVLDTVTVEPHLARAMLVWRASVPLRKKPTALAEIWVGERSLRGTAAAIARRRGKPVFAGISATLAWLSQYRRGGS